MISNYSFSVQSDDLSGIILFSKRQWWILLVASEWILIKKKKCVSGVPCSFIIIIGSVSNHMGVARATIITMLFQLSVVILLIQDLSKKRLW